LVEDYHSKPVITVVRQLIGDLIMSGFAPSKSVNPWAEGDYRVYGYAIPAPDGTYWPAYIIERIQGISDAPKKAVELLQVDIQTFATQGLAKMMAVSHGLQRVRNKDRLGC
jgi:hypothetical protein